MESIRNTNRFNVCFDEVHNGISNRKQLDLYFDEKERQVQKAYIGSSFMGHGQADLCLERLKETPNNLNYTDNLVQVIT